MPSRAQQAFVRLARPDDLDSLAALAALTGGGMTNLPDDRNALAEKIAWSSQSITATVTEPGNEFYLLVLDDGQGHILGTASLISRLGAKWPFYSFRLTRVTHVSRDLDRTFSTKVLHLVNDFDGASEVSGLFLHPDARAGGLGALLARSRYMFIAQHRERFGNRLVADLRGWTEQGRSPVWDAIAGPFFGRAFDEADLYNAIYGNQFIIDLMPRYPIYVSMLPQDAHQALGRPHDSSVPALRMLEAEDFVQDGYCDIFDGGPTVSARTDAVETIRHCKRPDPASTRLTCRWKQPLVAEGLLELFRVRLDQSSATSPEAQHDL